MLPNIKIAFFSIPSYSFMVFLGLIAFTVFAILVLEKKEKKAQKITNRLLILSGIGFIVLAVGALTLNSLFHSIEKGRVVIGGITWLGGVVVAFPVMILLIHKFCPLVKGEALEYFNLLLPGIVLAHGFGRIGCFLGGCCFGAPTDSVLGISFPAGSEAARLYPSSSGGSVPVLPTQLIEAVFEFLLFVLMLVLYKRLKRHFLEAYCIGYGVFRFSLEFLRGDDRGSTGAFVTPSQFMSILLIVGGILVLLYHRDVIFKKLKKRMEQLRSERIEYGYDVDSNTVKALRDLKRICDDGIITQEEFEASKKDILTYFVNNTKKSK